MNNESISWHESQAFPDIIYNYFKIPADLQQAELHGLAYRVYKEPYKNSTQCNCCNYYKDHIKFKLCDELNNDCFVASEYFQTIKWMLIQLTILCIFFVPFGLFYNRQGNECEQHPNCNQNSLKIYSIWNLVPNYFSLADIRYAIVILLTSFIFIILIKCGSFNTQMIKVAISLKTFWLLLNGVYFPERITNQEILDFLNRNSEICNQIYLVNQKLYQNILFEKLKSPYLREKQQHNKERKWYQEKYLMTMKILDNDIIKEDEIKKDFIQLCKEQDQKCYYGFQIRSPYFQFCIQVIIAGIYSQPLIIAQFIILKIRYDIINIYNNEEEDYIIKQFLNVCLTLLSMITFMIFDQIGQKILNRLQLYMIFYMFYLQSLDFETWNMFQNNFTQSSYKMLQNEGMIDYLITLSYLNLIVPSINQIFDYNYFWKKIKLQRLKTKKTNNKTQREANQLFQLREFNFYQKQIALSKIFAISLMFGFQYPLIIPLSMLSLLIVFWIDKYLFINYAIPVVKDKYEELLQGGYFLFNICMLFIFFGQCFMFFKYWITIILYLIFIILLLILIIVAYKERDQWINTKEILNELIEKQYQISNDEKYQMFLSLQKRLKKFVQKQKKINVVNESNLLD
ncbi:unnamed protein product [Paramecium primaurelia]|uniref:Transmembrane protein n=1 Tax=Paramecium primaurelia TaxID=5886 RepID=A0A8S1Q626_PARPR|nr:unnamed protein product [Paramecium primaurelia]